ncbi:hypothetical protein LTR70_009267 [Exophiala xenobiotica]|nr:hypothetical protein LTR70_009267 [Exophiala xenobiotica]
MQSGSRRHSARLQQKEESNQPISAATTNGTNGMNGATATTTKVQTSAANTRKRKSNYDEEDDGFVFSRVKKKRPRVSANVQPEAPQPLSALPEIETTAIPSPRNAERSSKQRSDEQNVAPAVPPKKRKRMSFSTPGAKGQQPVRRSKRLSTEAQEDRGSPVGNSAQELRPQKMRQNKAEKHKPPADQNEALPQEQAKHNSTLLSEGAPPTMVPPDQTHSSTKISLPFADTPVISRNKAMREGKSGKGERRSSLGLRGRRASSLIDSGTSNALPHTEVEPQDFYKHIESDLMEPRRMRQLLTWCATRAMHPKPQGTNFEEASARSAARVIEEELLKDLANKSELSDWFIREDAPEPVVPLPEKPNPKNTQNAEKIAELEEQIRRLRSEKDALEALLRPPSILDLPTRENDSDSDVNLEALSESDADILRSLNSNANLSADIASRVNKVTSDLGPAVDIFADGVHKINHYRMGGDGIASQRNWLTEKEQEEGKHSVWRTTGVLAAT